MATTTTLATLYERLALLVFAGHNPIRSTATGGTTSTWVDANVATPSSSAHAYNGVQIHIIDDAGGVGAPEDEARVVSSAGFAQSTGTWTVSPVFTTSPASSDIALFYYGLYKEDLREAINDIVRNLMLPRYLPLSLVTDGDMESSDATTNWADIVGTPTQTKTTTAANVLTGQRALSLVIATSGHAATSLSVKVTEQETLVLSVPVMVDAGSLTVQLYNVTASSSIREVTVDQEDWTEVRFAEQVPDNCEEVAVRLLAASASTTAYVGWVSLLSRNKGNTYPLPTSVAEVTDIDEVLYLPQGRQSEESYSYMAFTDRLRPWPHWEPLRDYAGANSHRIQITKPCDSPLFVKFRANGTALSAVTDTTVAPVEVVVEGAASIALKKLAARTRDPDRRRVYVGLAQSHLRVYNHLLEGSDLLKPVVKTRPQNRVYAA